MLILLTNDDGISHPGLLAMYRQLTQLGEVHVVAPDTVQSATGHGITVATPILTNRVAIGDDFVGTSIGGRPADCVKVAVAKLLPRMPDLVVSGINSGANVGINVIYSGTVAAAIEAAFLGLPAIAVSLHTRSDVVADYPRTAAYAIGVIQQCLAAGLRGGQIVTANFPALGPQQVAKGIKIVRQCTNYQHDSYESRRDPRGREYFWNDTVFTLGPTEEDTDVAALRDGYITLTPLQFDLTHAPLLREWSQKKWTLPA